MAQSPPPTLLHRSALVRVLCDLTQAAVPESPQPFAERLGQWLDFKDGLALFAVLDGNAPAAKAPSAAPPAQSAALWKAFARVRDSLTESISKQSVPETGPAPAQPTSWSPASANAAADFALYRQYYLAEQRKMTASIAPLRATVRAALSKHSPALARLAALDAVLDKALLSREAGLLATVPARLAKRFAQRYDAHRAALEQTGTADDPDRWLQPGGWLALFHEEMRAVLLAELELRLQPVRGLIAALDHEVTESLE